MSSECPPHTNEMGILPQELPRMIPAQEVVPTMWRILNEFQSVRGAVTRDVNVSTACFANVVQPLIEVGNRANGEWAVIAMLRYASPDKAAREASEEALRLFSEWEAEEMSRGELYVLLKAVKEKGEDLDSESRKYLRELLEDYTRCGHGTLDGDQIAKYLESRNTIDRQRRQFARNIMDNDEGLWFTEDELDGVPSADMERFKSASEQDGGKRFFVQFTRADVLPVYKYARSTATRKRLYTSQYKTLEENVQLFKEVIVQRDVNARMLGYSSHAAFRLERRMAKNPQWVHTFLDKLQQVLLPLGRTEMQALLAKKKEHIQLSGDQEEYPDIMPPWDLHFYTRLASEEFRLDDDAVAEYFPLETTVCAMLDIFSHCLQLEFVRLSPEQVAESVWHEDVQVWSVWDKNPDSPVATGQFVGYLYMDLLFRPNKYRGSQDVNLQSSFVDGTGTRIYPATILMCAFARPTPTTCALLKHRDVVSVFHELGHGIHDLLARTQYARFHGYRSPPDFVEAPSVMLENWCWMRQELRKMSCHFTTLDPSYLQGWLDKHPGESAPPRSIPDDLLESLLATRNQDRVLHLLHLLSVSRFDMTVHDPQSHEECLQLDPTALFNQTYENIRLLPVPDPKDRGHPHAHFGHLVSGYDAGYYAYLSAEVLAADLFESNFAKDPRNQDAWDRYRHGILEYGASRDELDILREFLGREPSPSALLRRLGLQDGGGDAQ